MCMLGILLPIEPLRVERMRVRLILSLKDLYCGKDRLLVNQQGGWEMRRVRVEENRRCFGPLWRGPNPL